MKIIKITNLQEKIKNTFLTEENLPDEGMIGKSILQNKIEFFIIEKEMMPQLAEYEAELSQALDSCAYVACRYSITDFIGNSYDAGATEITLDIPENKELIDDRVIITLKNNGNKFPDHMLLGKEEKNPLGKKVQDLLKKEMRVKFNSTKVKGEGHGGAGIGLARVSTYLSEEGGGIYLSNNEEGQEGVKIIFESSLGLADEKLALVRKYGVSKRKHLQALEERFPIIMIDDEGSSPTQEKLSITLSDLSSEQLCPTENIVIPSTPSPRKLDDGINFIVGSPFPSPRGSDEKKSIFQDPQVCSLSLSKKHILFPLKEAESVTDEKNYEIPRLKRRITC